VSGLPAEVARSLHGPVVALQKATAALASRLDRLCDPGLTCNAREEDTTQLYSELEDAELALEAFGDVVLGGERAAPGDLVVVVRVARTRWRRHGWAGHRPGRG
jgi:hypothetical protein